MAGSGSSCSGSKGPAAQRAQRDSLVLRQGVLYRKCDSRDFGQAQMQLVVSEVLGKEVLVQLHDVPTSGHLGVTKCFQS